MSLVAVILDTTPLGLASQRKGKSSEADACLSWVRVLLTQGVRVYVPEIADYEVRRSLVRASQTNSVARLDAFGQLARYLPITTDAMRTAAGLWAATRNAGLPTAPDSALDGDVIVAAQALSLQLPMSDFIVATGDVKHLARFVPADLGTNILI